MFLSKREFHKKGVVQRKGKHRRQAFPAVRKVWGTHTCESVMKDAQDM